jgi:manganese/zinc/iron transport system substrate-binding protein
VHGWKSSNGKIRVLSSIAMIDDLVKQIGGEYVDNLTLIKGELDPHSYQLVKGDDEKMSYAQLIFYNGLGLEHGPSFQKHLFQNPKAIGLGEKIRQENPEMILYFNGHVDPHIWMDISIWSSAISGITEALSYADPDHAEFYRSNGAKLKEQMLKEHNEIRDMMQALPESKRYLVTSHDAFHYFARAYLATEEERKANTWEKRFAAPEGLSPESQISVKDIRTIIEYLSRYNIHVLFAETNVSKDSIRKIVQAGRDKGLNIKIADKSLYADAMGGPETDGDTYLKMMRYDANTIARFLALDPNRGTD